MRLVFYFAKIEIKKVKLNLIRFILTFKSYFSKDNKLKQKQIVLGIINYFLMSLMRQKK